MKKRHTLLLLATAVFLSLQLFSQTTYQKLIGGAVDERNTYCFEAADGNILIAGHTTSGGAGGEDIFVMKTDTMMNIIWSRTYGGPGDDYLVDRLPIAQNTSPYYPTPDGGFFLIGFTNSFGQGSNDFYLLRIDKDGNLLWSKTYGTPAIERGVTINRYPNGNLVLGGDVEEGPFGGKDVFLIITDSLGNMIKNQQVGKGGHDQLFFAQPTIDFGYIYAGATSSEGSGGFDAHLVRFDINANPVWSKIYGGPANDSYNGVIEIYGSAFLAVGYTQSFGAGSHDFLLSMFTDNGDLLWSKTYGGTNSDIADHVIQTSDGGYAIVGTTQSFGGGGADIMVVKTDANGDLQWTKTYGGAGEDISRSIDEIQSGGYHICGATSSFLTNPDPGMGGYESYAIRTDANGNTGCNEFSVTPSVSSPTLTTNYYFPDTTNTAGLEAYAPTQTDTIIFYQRVLCENIPQPTAINYTWNGSGSGGWNSPTNWTPTGIPTDIDNVTIVTAPNAPYISSNPVIVHKLIMNNDAGLTVSQIFTVTDTLELISGIISNTSPLNLNNNSVVIGGNNTSFVSGTVTKFGNTAFTFPVGKLNNYQPLTISAPANEVEAFTAGYNNSVQGFGATLDTGLTDLSTCEHWTLQRNTGTSTVNVTLGWNASSCNVPSTISNARVASWDGVKWKNLGNSATTGNVTAGTVTSSVPATTYTAFALAQRLQAPTDYNFYSGAVNLAMNSTSANAAYSTVGATSDNNPGPCWNTTGGSNVWFKFTANSTQQVSVQLFTGGASGTIQYPYIAIWQADGTTLVKCNTYASQYDNVEVGAVSLTSGATYYISVDNNNGSAAYRGTFKLSINDAVNYDYYQGATDVSPIINSCSAANAYTTTGATTDKTPGTCWNTTAGSNRWFKFVATSTQIKVEVKTAGGAGSLQYPYAALWSADGNTQLACQTYSSQYSNLSMSKIGLTVGNTYYISVDNHNGSAAYRGAFQLCLADAVDYDYYEGAVDVSSIINNCSAVNAYTTVQATSDKNPGSCWNTTGGSNRWFKFVATSAQLKVEVKTTGVAGSIQYPYVALWSADGTTQLACQTYSSQYSNLGMNKTGLTIGNTYYISVDNHNGSAAYRGTFQLCLSDAVDYDYYEGAVDVSSIINNCSAVNAYTTVQATFDKNKGACWNTLGGSNRWFKFVATSTQIKLEVKTTGVAGSIQYPYVALWAADGTTQLACQTYSSQYSNLSLNKPGLTVGATYYISVDNNTSSAAFRGTFQLCLSDAVDYDYHEGAVDVSSLMNNCSAVNAYSTVQATADKNPGSCWNTIGGSNRWFKFVATSTQIKVEVKTTGLPGSLRYHYAALWGADGTTPVACQTYSSQFSNLSMNTTGLTVGNTYYISVDNHNGSASYRGSFQLCLSDAVDYDFYEGAVDVSSIMNNCSAVNAYTTVQATLDKNPGSCWNTTGGSNRWFKFVATTAQIKVEVKTAGVPGSIQYPYVALWAADGTTPVACQTYSAQYSNLSMSKPGLTIGSTYYISVDNHNGSASYRGTFQLCLSNAVDYDFFEGAIDVSSLIDTCSAANAYTTVQATSDRTPGSCWNTIGGSNRWFKFVASSNKIKVEVKTTGVTGSLQYPYLALWSGDGNTQLACQKYTTQYSNLSVYRPDLIAGNTYYISVDNNNGSAAYRGSFQLCLLDSCGSTQAEINGENSVCQGSLVTLTATPAGTTYSWSTGAETQVINASIGSTTAYTVTIAYANSCTRVATKTVTVLTTCFALTIDVSDLDTIVNGDTLKYILSGAGLSGTHPSGTSITYNAITPGTGDSSMINLSFFAGASGEVLNLQFAVNSAMNIGGGYVVMDGVPFLLPHTHFNHDLGPVKFFPPVFDMWKTPLTYCTLKRKLDAGYFIVNNGALRFKFDEEYNDTDGKLSFKIYDDLHHAELVNSSSLSSPLQLNSGFGERWYSLNILNCGITSNGNIGGGYYILEVQNEKKEKWYLRFKHVASMTFLCPPTGGGSEN